MTKPKVRIVVTDSTVVNGELRVSGRVYGHPRFDDGTEVTTSSVASFVTRNTNYEIELVEAV